MEKPWRVQRHHIEFALIAASSLRLVTELLGGWPSCDRAGAAAALAALTLLSLLLEAPPRRATRYAVRAAESDGIAQGALAAPSVLAALLVADPNGGWLPWFAISCAAALGTLWHIWRETRPAAPGKGGGAGARAPPADVAAVGTAAAAAAAATGAAARGEAGAGNGVGPVTGGYVTRSHARRKQGAAATVGAAAAGDSGDSSTPTSEDGGGGGIPGSSTGPWWRGKGGSRWCAVASISGGGCGGGGLGSGHLAALCAPALVACAAALMSPPLAGGSNGGSDSSGGGSSGAGPAGAGLGLAGAAAAALMGAAAPPTFRGLMGLLPRTLSLGECALLVQGALLAAASAAWSLRELPAFAAAVAGALSLQPWGAGGPAWGGAAAVAATRGARAGPDALLSPFVCLLVASVLLGSAAVWAATAAAGAAGAAGRRKGAPRSAPAPLLARLAAPALAAPAAGGLLLLAAWTLLVFVPAAPTRVWLLAYWAAVLAAVLPLMRLAAAHKTAPQIILRKGYHLLAAALFLPAFFWDLPLLCASLAIAFAALVAAEAARCARVPVLGRAVQEFMQDFVDERDAGPLYVTHFTLLLGLALPMWLAAGLPCAAGSSGGGGSGGEGVGAAASWWATAAAGRGAACGGLLPGVLAGLSGTMVIGFGDTMASVIGRTYGRVPIHHGSRKTAEGTAAGAVSTLAGWWAVLLAACNASAAVAAARPGGAQWAQLAAATAGACLLEACTSQLDNILIPLWYFPHCLLVSPARGA